MYLTPKRNRGNHQRTNNTKRDKTVPSFIRSFIHSELLASWPISPTHSAFTHRRFHSNLVHKGPPRCIICYLLPSVGSGAPIWGDALSHGVDVLCVWLVVGCRAHCWWQLMAVAMLLVEWVAVVVKQGWQVVVKVEVILFLSSKRKANLGTLRLGCPLLLPMVVRIFLVFPSVQVSCCGSILRGLDVWRRSCPILST